MARSLSLPLVAAALLAALALGGSAYYYGPLGREVRLQHEDLIALDAETSNDRDGLAWYYLGRRFRLKGADPQATLAFGRAYELRPKDQRVLIALAESLLDSGQIDPAFQVLKTAESQAPDNLETKRLLGRLYQRRGSYHHALELWNQVIAKQPADADAWYWSAFCHLQTQQIDQSRAAIDRANQSRPRDPKILRLRGSIAAAAGNLPLARQSFEAAIAADPRDARSHHDIANFMLTQSRSPEDVERADLAVKELARLSPEFPLLSWHRARLAYYRKDYATAVRETEQTLGRQPGLEEAYFQLANAYYRLGNRERGDTAMRSFRRRSELRRRTEETEIRLSEKKTPELYFQLADLKLQGGDPESARQSLENGLKMAPKSLRGAGLKKRIEAAERPPQARQ